MRDSKLRKKILRLSDQNVKTRTEFVMFDAATQKKDRETIRREQTDRSSDKVFSYWAEGELKSPPIVRMCIDS